MVDDLDASRFVNEELRVERLVDLDLVDVHRHDFNPLGRFAFNATLCAYEFHAIRQECPVATDGESHFVRQMRCQAFQSGWLSGENFFRLCGQNPRQMFSPPSTVENPHRVVTEPVFPRSVHFKLFVQVVQQSPQPSRAKREVGRPKWQRPRLLFFLSLFQRATHPLEVDQTQAGLARHLFKPPQLAAVADMGQLAGRTLARRLHGHLHAEPLSESVSQLMIDALANQILTKKLHLVS